MQVRLLILRAAAVVLAGCATAFAVDTLHIPRVKQPPTLADFDGMQPHGAAAALARVGGFLQRDPSDGQPATQRTDAYLGYDSTNLYVAFVCWDTNPQGVFGHLTRREPSTPFDAEDYVEVTLDTFHDERHAFVFDVNPRGVQADALWTEGQGGDYSWDTVWDSRARLTPQGYVVLISVPFRSLRFRDATRPWGVILMRYIARNDEDDFWPRVSSRVSGRLNQEATLTGFERIAPGRNLQFIPYAEMRSFRALDTQDPLQPRFTTCTACGKMGLDSKIVFHDSLVLDATINPDFAQVESDEPQNTINQRFEVYFPEKRPFFLENSNFFEAPLIGFGNQARMMFTRRIADPTFGVRLSGKQGPWNLGFLVADDRSPGLIVPLDDPLHGKRAYFTVGRVSYDFGQNLTIGAMYTGREFVDDFNHVGGLDGMWRIGKNWNATYRGYMSSTRDSASYLFGQHHEAVVVGSGRRFNFFSEYLDITPGFRTETGFVQRTDQRALNEYFHFYWRPEGKHLILHGIEENVTQMWDHRGNVVQQVGSFDYAFDFRPDIILAPIIAYESDVLRPEDFAGLTANHKYSQDSVGLVFRGSPWRMFSWSTRLFRQGTVVVVPTVGLLPYTGNETSLNQTVSLRPLNSLVIDNTYILDRVVNGAVNHAVFNNHIVRTKWNYQFTPKFSLRFIGQYNGLLANPLYSSLSTQKNVNFDVLFTYLAHPGTAVYVGYNSNLENIDPGLCVRLAGSTECDPNGIGLLRSQNHLINDGRQVFIKISYLFRK